LYSSELTSVSTTLALSLIRQYLDTYRSRLKPKHLLYMRQLLAVVAALDQFLQKRSDAQDEVLTIQRLVILVCSPFFQFGRFPTFSAFASDSTSFGEA
uniref:NR LBD domain-containing protein n=1 Tax=Heligmosomoides polygyrus TaxID=6339 RepID=A0A183FCU7_HELPZ